VMACCLSACGVENERARGSKTMPGSGPAHAANCAEGRHLVEAVNVFQSLGLELPSPLYIAGAIVFGLIGLVAYRNGRRSGRPVTRWLGVALMLYPYAISRTWLLYVVGAALCAAIAFDNR
jgi:hypothetical protein